MDNCCNCGLSDESPEYHGSFNLPDGRVMCVGCYENRLAELELALELACSDASVRSEMEAVMNGEPPRLTSAVIKERYIKQARAKIKEQS